MRLTRQLFPLLFQFVLIFCDATIDAEQVFTEEEEAKQKQAKLKFLEFGEQQKSVIDHLTQLLKTKGSLSNEQL